MRGYFECTPLTKNIITARLKELGWEERDQVVMGLEAKWIKVYDNNEFAYISQKESLDDYPKLSLDKLFNTDDYKIAKPEKWIVLYLNNRDVVRGALYDTEIGANNAATNIEECGGYTVIEVKKI